MVTPEFEEWLRRQDIPVEDTISISRYRGYLAEEFGIKGDSLVVAETVWREQYETFEGLGITPFTWHTVIAGEPFYQTRYGIKGYPGAWGREGMLDIAETKAEEQGLTDTLERIRAIKKEEGYE